MIAIGTVLSFFLRPTSFLAPLAAGAIAGVIGFGGGYVRGYTHAIGDYKVASLQQQVTELRQAAETSERLSDENARMAETHAHESAVLRSQIKEISDAQPAGDICRLGPERLRQLRSIAAKVS